MEELPIPPGGQSFMPHLTWDRSTQAAECNDVVGGAHHSITACGANLKRSSGCGIFQRPAPWISPGEPRLGSGINEVLGKGTGRATHPIHGAYQTLESRDRHSDGVLPCVQREEVIAPLMRHAGQCGNADQGASKPDRVHRDSLGQ
jgi:hypothetical protein